MLLIMTLKDGLSSRAKSVMASANHAPPLDVCCSFLKLSSPSLRVLSRSSFAFLHRLAVLLLRRRRSAGRSAVATVSAIVCGVLCPRGSA
jgi:hypothetical protein